MPRALLQRIKAQAGVERRTIANMIRLLLEEGINGTHKVR
jgi:hypothetical protein